MCDLCVLAMFLLLILDCMLQTLTLQCFAPYDFINIYNAMMRMEAKTPTAKQNNKKGDVHALNSVYRFYLGSCSLPQWYSVKDSA